MIRSRDEANALLRDLGPDEWAASAEALERLPPDVDVALAEGAARLVARKAPLLFGRFCRHLPATVIRRLLQPNARDDDVTLLFLRAAVPLGPHDATVATAWREAVGALAELYRPQEWPSPSRRAKFEAVARSRFLGAIQAAAVAHENVPIEMLAVLASDGSEASLDALLPHFDGALRRRDDSLNQLALLRPHAATVPSLMALLDETDRLIDERAARSPALDFARTLGLEVSQLNFEVVLDSIETDDGRPRVEGLLWVDSRRAAWLGCALRRPGRRGETSWTSDGIDEDALGVGSCEAEEIPAWLVRTAARLGFAFRGPLELRAPSLARRDRERVAAWLRGGAR